MKTLEEHVARWRDCRRCGLCAARTQVVTGSWFLQKPTDGDPLVVVIGEVPGADEDRTGEGFVGVSGQLLRNEILIPAGVKLAFLANCCACFPDGNRDPSPQELEACMPRLLELLDVLQPDGVLAVGRFAAERMGVMRIRIPTVTIRHPAWMLRKGFAERQRVVASAVKAVQRLLHELGVVGPKADRPEHVHRPVPGGVWRAVDGAEEPFKLCADCGVVVEEAG